MQNIFIIYSAATGQISRKISCLESEISHQLEPGELFLEVDDTVSDATHYISQGAIAEFPTKPHELAEFDFTTQQWIISENSNLVAWTRLREERDQKLSACDWTQVADAPVDHAAWAAYRQALRDLPEATADPFAPVWPAEPE